MKSFKSLALACLLSMGALAACGGDDVEGLVKNIKGGSHDEKLAIQECVLNKPIALLKGTTITPDIAYDAKFDDGDFLQVTSKQVGVEINMTMYDVDIEWEIANTNNAIKATYNVSDTQKMVYFNFDESGDKAYSFSIKKIKCGRAVSENPEVEYTINLKKPTYKYDDETIEHLYALRDEPIDKGDPVSVTGEYGFQRVKYDQKSPYFIGNNEGTDYYYVRVNGEMIYEAPDGNWGLLADGDKMIEVYAGSGSGTPINGGGFPVLNLSKQVEITSEFTVHAGCLQLSYVNYMVESSAANKKTAVKTFQKVTPEFIDKVSTVYTDGDGNEKQSDLQCVPGMNLTNALVEVTGTYVEGSLSVDRIVAGARATFRLKVSEGHEYTVAYDYHVDKTGSIGFARKLNEAIESGKPITIKGTNRYCTLKEKENFLQGFSNPGDWQVVPFDLSHISF